MTESLKVEWEGGSGVEAPRKTGPLCSKSDQERRDSEDLTHTSNLKEKKSPNSEKKGTGGCLPEGGAGVCVKRDDGHSKVLKRYKLPVIK